MQFGAGAKSQAGGRVASAIEDGGGGGLSSGEISCEGGNVGRMRNGCHTSVTSYSFLGQISFQDKVTMVEQRLLTEAEDPSASKESVMQYVEALEEVGEKQQTWDHPDHEGRYGGHGAWLK
jgi:hypothetical protein